MLLTFSLHTLKVPQGEKIVRFRAFNTEQNNIVNLHRGVCIFSAYTLNVDEKKIKPLFFSIYLNGFLKPLACWP